VGSVAATFNPTRRAIDDAQFPLPTIATFKDIIVSLRSEDILPRGKRQKKKMMSVFMSVAFLGVT
jgi:hypothetical protein